VSYACGINAPLDELRRGFIVSRGYEDRAKDRVRSDGPILARKVFGRRQSKNTISSSVPRRATLLVTFEHDGDQHSHGKFRDM
jgi:hypothetical protein